MENRDPKISIHLKEGKIKYEEYYLLPRKVMFHVKSFVFQYKFLKNILVNNFGLKKWKIIQNDFCTFCNIECETLLHLFWDYDKIKAFWQHIRQWCTGKSIYFDVKLQDILLGNLEKEPIYNIILFLGKQFIHSCRNNNEPKQLNIESFIAYVKFYKQTEFNISVKNNCVSRFIHRWHLLQM